MSDIFLSYKSEDRSRAKIFAKTLEQQGYSVWWDKIIPPGKTFDEVIEEALNAAKCVIVLWSEQSVLSDWVKEEATVGAMRHILIPVLIDDVTIPLGFKRIQTARLIDWQGTLPNPEFDQLNKSIDEIIGQKRSIETNEIIKNDKINHKYGFHDLNKLLIGKNGLDFLIVTGHNEHGEQGIPLKFDEIRGGNFSDLEYIPKLILLFAKKYYEIYGGNIESTEIRIVSDIYLKLTDIENHNLIVLGAANVNSFTKYIFDTYPDLKVRFLSGGHEKIKGIKKNYFRKEEGNIKELRDYAILQMVPNFWNQDKVIILCSGIDLWGTQAAICALCKPNLSNNIEDDKYPAKVLSVELKSDLINIFDKTEFKNFVTIIEDSIKFEE